MEKEKVKYSFNTYYAMPYKNDDVKIPYRADHYSSESIDFSLPNINKNVKIPYKTGGFSSIFEGMVKSQAENSDWYILDDFVRCDKDEDEILSKEEIKNYTTRNELNGYIGDISQGNFGDCLLLGQLLAFSQHEWGRAIIKHSLNIKEDSYSRKFYIKQFEGMIDPQIKEITVTKDEIDTAKKNSEGNFWKSKAYSTGDDDAIAHEIMIEKLFGYFKKEGLPTDNYYEALSDMSYLLYGKTNHILYNMKYNICEESIINNGNGSFKPYIKFDKEECMQDIIANQKNYIMYAVFDDQKLDNLHGNHCYAIKKISKDGVELINPHDSRYVKKISYDVFMKSIYNIRVYKNPNIEQE